MMFEDVVILADEQGHPVFLEFKHPEAPSFRTLVVFSSLTDARTWVDANPAITSETQKDYQPVAVHSIEPIDAQYKQVYGRAMSVINMSDVMHLSRVVG